METITLNYTDFPTLTLCTFIFLTCAVLTISCKSCIAYTGKGSNSVITLSIYITVICTTHTLIYICKQNCALMQSLKKLFLFQYEIIPQPLLPSMYDIEIF